MPILPLSGTAVSKGALIPVGVFNPVSPATSVTFTNIPQGYQDLMAVVYVRSNSTAIDNFFYRINGDASSLYSATYLEGDGSNAASTRETGNAQQFLGTPNVFSAAPGIFALGTLNLANYANTNTFKSAIFQWAYDRNGSGITTGRACLYRSTTAITSVTFFLGTGPFTTGTRISLYAVRSVNQ